MKKYQCGESEDENLQGLETHTEYKGDIEMNTYEIPILEAQKVEG